MNILAIDSSSAACAICVWQDGRILAAAHEAMQRGQDARLMPMIVGTMAKARLDFAALDKIAVTRGPGSFTGLRVGLAAASGIGLAAGKPVIGIDRFAIYRALNPTGDLLVVIESKRAELFCRFFSEDGVAHEPCLMTQTDIDAFLAEYPQTKKVGDGVAAENDSVIAACARLAADADETNEDYAPRPLYLRAPDVTFPSDKGATAR